MTSGQNRRYATHTPPYIPIAFNLRRTFCAAGLAVAVALALLPAQSHAQSNATDAALNGYITDAQGGSVANAHIVARDLGTNISTEVVSDSNGYYRFPILKIGKYEVIVKASGFSDLKQDGITLSVGNELRDDATLTMGAASTSIEVTADASVLDTSTPTVGATLDSKSLRVLPITSRNIYNYEFFSPGVKGYPTSTFSAPQPAFDGITSTILLLDGVDNTQRNGATPIRLVITTPEVVEQSQIIVNGASAEFGRTAGGIANVVTRRGGDEYHGQVFAALRPNALRGTNALITTGHPTSKWQDYDGNIGGPIIKNRMFFFANFEFNTLANPLSISITPANAAILGIPPNEIGEAIASERYPTPSIRVDNKLNDKTNMFLRWSSFSNEEPNNNGGGYIPAGTYTFFHDRMQGGEAQLATAASASLLNEFRFGVTRRDTWQTNMQPAQPTDVLIAISNVATIGNNSTLGTHTIEQNIDGVDNITKTVGKHTFKFGADYENTDIQLTSSLTKTYTFADLPSYENTINGVSESYQLATFQVGNPKVNNRWNFFNAFFQDEFRLNRKLTVNYGVRYQLISWPALNQAAPYAYSRNIKTSRLDFAPRLSASYQINPSTVVRAAGGLYFDTPNLGVFDNVSQLNGANILTYTYTPNQTGAPIFPNIPTTATELVSSVPNIAAYDPNYRDMYSFQSNVQIEHSFTNNLSVNVDYQFLGIRRGPYSHDTNLGAPLCSLADGRPAYTAKTCGTGSSTTIARPNTGFGQINLLSSGSNMSYNGLDITVKKRLSQGLQFQATYAWSKALGTVDQANSSVTIYGTPIEDPTNLARDYGPMSSDVRNNFVLQGFYSPTFSLKELAWTNRIQLSTMTYIHSGLPINVYNGSDPSGDNVSNARPLFVGRNSLRGPNLYEEDPRLSYDIPLMERLHLNLYSEAENIFNHPNWNCSASSGCTSAVNNNITSSAFLHPTSDRNPRGFNFGSKITF